MKNTTLKTNTFLTSCLLSFALGASGGNPHDRGSSRLDNSSLDAPGAMSTDQSSVIVRAAKKDEKQYFWNQEYKPSKNQTRHVLPTGEKLALGSRLSEGKRFEAIPEPRVGSTDSELITLKEMKAIQKKLALAGFYEGAFHGIKDENTIEAISNYQKKIGIEETGALNDETLYALGMRKKMSDEESNMYSE